MWLDLDVVSDLAGDAALFEDVAPVEDVQLGTVALFGDVEQVE